VQCSSCPERAVIDQPYRGAHACSTHFAASVEARFRREMRRQLPRYSKGTIAVALSGGKDSSVALFLSARYFGRRPAVRLVAITVDEGIDGYRGPGLTAASGLASSLGIEHRVVSAADELGTTTDRLAAALPGTPPCSFCGVWRRTLLNRAARAAGADGLILGFNLDDLAQTVLMNLVRGDLEHLVQMAPHVTRRAGLVPRLAPLAGVPEREVFLYARLSNLPFDHRECPHAGRALRNRFRETVWQLEEAQPGTRQALLRTHERIRDLWVAREGGTALLLCRMCGEPSSAGLCRACQFLSMVRPPAGTEAEAVG
jgi:uncharacterized protein (TIGR00269 family)